MFGFLTKSINRKLVLFILAVTVLPIVLVTVLGVWKTADMLIKQKNNELNALRINKGRLISGMINNTKHNAVTLAMLDELPELLDNKPNAKAAYVKSAMAKVIASEDVPGVIVYSVKKSAPTIVVGVDEQDVVAAFPNSTLDKFCREVVKTKKVKFLDYMYYPPISDQAMFIGVPVLSDDRVVGALLLMVNIGEMDSIMLETTGLGKTGETFLVGEDGYLRSSCRKRHEAGIKSIMKFKIHENMLQKALQSDKGNVGFMINSHDLDSLVSYGKIDLKKFNAGFNWVIIAHIDTDELMAPIVALVWQIIITGVVLSIVTGIFGYLLARSVSKPLGKLSEKIVKLAGGDLTMEQEEVKRDDEIGALMTSFNKMLLSLRSQTKDIQQGTAELASAIVQITAAVSELAANSTETSTSITEISTTMEEVKQTTHVAADKATYVSDTAARVTSISDEGTKVTREAVNGMNHIKEEMGSLAESIVKLSGQTQSIGEIINTVSDLAEQSNLLAVNAAIEAAKAGEFGKGFAVVAQEIKSLAEQSKASTKQISSILNDIQQATSGAVMATERSSKAVDNGVQLSETAGNAINTLAGSIAESASAASQIAASGNQQLIGIDQLATALDSIRDATSQSLTGIKQLEGAASSMKELSQKLKSITEQFSI
jgi:methyl-accepting chemotaxis protein